MKIKLNKRVFSFLAIALFLFSSIGTVFAEDDVTTSPPEAVDDTDKGYLSAEELEKELGEIYANATTSKEAYETCIASEKISEDQKRLYCTESKPSVLDDGILSLNPEIREIEKGTKYYLKFQNGSETATYTSFKLTDLGNSLTIFISNFLSNVFEWISKLMAFLVMFVINASSSGVVSNAITNGMNTLRDMIFGDVTKAIPLLVIFFFIGLIKRLLNEQNIFSIRSLFMMIWSTLVSFLFVLFIVFPGTQVLNHVDMLANETMAKIVVSMTSDEESSNQSMDMVLKEEAFYVMVEQPFMMRHFGDMSIEGIASRLGISEEEAQSRYDFMLNAPNYASAKKEYNDGNTYIIHNALTASANVIVSLVMMVHRILIGIVYIVLCVVLIFLDIFKGIMIGLTFTALFSFIMRSDFRGGKWLANRLTWIFTLLAVQVFATFIFKTLTAIITSFSRRGIFALLIGDIVLALLVFIAWKNKETIVKAVKNLSEPISQIMRGDVGLQEIGDGAINIKDGIIKGFGNVKSYVSGSDEGLEGSETNEVPEAKTVEDENLSEADDSLQEHDETLDNESSDETSKTEEVEGTTEEVDTEDEQNESTKLSSETDLQDEDKLDKEISEESSKTNEEILVNEPSEDNFDHELSDLPEEELEDLKVDIEPPKENVSAPQESTNKQALEQTQDDLDSHTVKEVNLKEENLKTEQHETKEKNTSKYDEIKEENNFSVDDYLKDLED